MGSSNNREMGLGTKKSSFYRKGKKGSSDKQKQPQRGLGVAKLEEIRLQNQMASYLPTTVHSSYHGSHHKEDYVREGAYSASPSSSPGTVSSLSLFPLQANTMLRFGETERTDVRYGGFECNPRASTRSQRNHRDVLQPRHVSVPETPTLSFLEQYIEDSTVERRRGDRRHSTGKISQASDSSDTHELDLELRLSLILLLRGGMAIGSIRLVRSVTHKN